MKTALLSVAFLTPLCFSQTTAPHQEAPPPAAVATVSCPVELLDVLPNGSKMDAFNAAMANTKGPAPIPPFRLKVRNTSAKDIQGIKFGAAYYDSVEDLHVIPVGWGIHSVLKAGKIQQGAWDNSIWHETATIGWVVWPIKILYTDGTRWEMSEDALGCHTSYWQDGMDHHLKLSLGALTQTPDASPVPSKH